MEAVDEMHKSSSEIDSGYSNKDRDCLLLRKLKFRSYGLRQLHIIEGYIWIVQKGFGLYIFYFFLMLISPRLLFLYLPKQHLSSLYILSSS